MGASDTVFVPVFPEVVAFAQDCFWCRFTDWMLQMVQLLACSRTAKVLLWAPWLSLFWLLDQNWRVWWTKRFIPQRTFVNLLSFTQEQAQTLLQSSKSWRCLSELRASATGWIYLSFSLWKTERENRRFDGSYNVTCDDVHLNWHIRITDLWLVLPPLTLWTEWFLLSDMMKRRN